MMNRHPAALLFALIAVSPIAHTEEADHAYVLKGTILTPDRLIAAGGVVIEHGVITQVGAQVRTPHGAIVVDVQGVILPGMIDLHDHLVWNVFPRWPPRRVFQDRYEWQEADSYKKALSGPNWALHDTASVCLRERYAEIKALAGGATSVVGTSPTRCARGLARNLDYLSGIGSDSVPGRDSIVYEVFPFDLPGDSAAKIQAGRFRAFLAHVGEGVDASARAEFRTFKRSGFLRARTTIIHGLALSDSDFLDMASRQVGLVWSPRSNIELYGATTNVGAAKRAGVRIAIGPDWSPAGSSGMLNELRYAAEWNHAQPSPIFSDSELIAMVTTVPARLVGDSDSIGLIAAGRQADLIVLALPPGSNSVRRDVIASGPADLRLVMVGGEPLYGDSALLVRMAGGSRLEFRGVCGLTKAINVIGQGIGESLSATDSALSARLQLLGTTLAPLQECH